MAKVAVLKTPKIYVVTFADFEIRYFNIREQNPKVKKCSVNDCSNPRDATPLLGEDTCCAYHRLLFDFWSCDVVPWDKTAYYFSHKTARRRAFTRWRNEIGKEQCDKIVLEMAQEGINWEC